MSVVAISSYKFVVLGCSTDHTCNYSFLSNIQMTESFDFLLTIKLPCLFFKFPNQQHNFIPLKVSLLIKIYFCSLGHNHGKLAAKVNIYLDHTNSDTTTISPSSVQKSRDSEN